MLGWSLLLIAVQSGVSHKIAKYKKGINTILGYLKLLCKNQNQEIAAPNCFCTM